MLGRSSSRTRQVAPQNQRTSSVQTPAIEIDDLSLPLESQEDLAPTPPRRVGTKATLGPRRRRRHTDLSWRKKWNRSIDPFRNGRVLVIDCYSRDSSDDGKRKTQTQEFTNEAELNSFYEEEGKHDKQHSPCLRIIHVQNALWARSLLFKRYGIVNSQTKEGTPNAFSRWAQYEKPQRRAGHPVLNARAFRVDKNVWRRVWRTGFGVDYLRYFTPRHMEAAEEPNLPDFKLMELKEWVETDESSYSAHGYDVYVQRLSVYVQRNMEDSGLAEDEWDDDSDASTSVELIKPTNDRGESIVDPPPNEILRGFDNTSTIIVFESSHSGLVKDTLIEARNEIERKWRRLFMDLPRDNLASDSELGLRCMDIAIGYVLNGLTVSWEKFLSKCDEHISILVLSSHLAVVLQAYMKQEERIYENPADEARAPELWSNSSLWLKVEKLLSLQISAVNNFKEYLKEVAMDERDFFRESPEQFKRLQTLIDEELIKPTTNLTDLMYKSVEIRDSRHSLQLGTSMWRLSWITFIFLPLTFLSGFFGMNVTTFQNSSGYPKIWWYFVAATPLMIMVLISVNVLKSMVDLRREDPLRKGTYETIYAQFTVDRPDLWSRVGPRNYVEPKGLLSRLKWRIVRHWFDPSRTIARKPLSDINDMGLVARVKHWIAKIWLKEIKIDQSTNPLNEAELGRVGPNGDLGAVFELIGFATPIAMADGDADIAIQVGEPLRKELISRRSRSSRGSSGSGNRPNFRNTSPSSHGVMVEEEDEDEEDEGEGENMQQSNSEDMEWQLGQLESKSRAERKKEREESPTAEGASSLLSVPTVNRQVLTSNSTSADTKSDNQSEKK